MSALERIRERMREHGLDALLVSDVGAVSWLTGFTGSSGFALVTPTEARFVTDSRYTLQAKEEVREMPSATYASPTEPADFLAAQAREMRIDRLGFDSETVSHSTWTKWQERFRPIELVPAPNLIGDLRMVKSEAEIEKIRRSCALADAAYDHVLRLIRPGVSEYDIGLDLEFFIRRQGADLAFAPIVVSGERSARPHGRASEKKLESGDFLTLDFGAMLDGYASDITRTVVVGRATDRQEAVYNQVLKAQLAALDMMRPGVRGRDVDAMARTVLDEMDLAQYFGHGLGHGLGRLVHDMGRLSATSEVVLEPGQVWTVEPGVYIADFGGVRIEDDVVVTDDGIEILTKSPKKFTVIGASE
jgi:Xaa-Pro aminopeptidase